MTILGKEIPENILPFYNLIMNKIKNPIMFADSKGKEGSTQNIDNRFIIKIDKELQDDYFWEILLHECLHVLQTKEGYRDFTSSDNHMISFYANNTIMDIDVDRRLKNMNFEYFSPHRREQAFLNTASIIRKYKLNGVYTDDIKILAVIMAYIKITYNNELVNILEEASKELSPKFEYYYHSFIHVVESHPQTTYKQVLEIQRQVIDLLEIKNYEFE